MKRDYLLKVVLSVVDAEYDDGIALEQLKSNNKLLNSALEYAQVNGLLYLFREKTKDLELDIDFSDEDLKYEKRFRSTLELLNKVSKESGISYILIKDCNNVPHIPRDIDIFVRSEDKSDLIRAFSECNVECEHSEDIETSLLGESCLPIDVYTKIIYFGHEFLEADFLFDSVQERSIFSIRYPGLNNESEFMLTLLHGLFGHRRITLLDFLHLKKIKESQLDLELCESYARTAKWGGAFHLILEKFNLIREEIYVEKKKASFPYLFDMKFVMKCIQQIDGIQLSQLDQFIIYFSLFLDGVKLKLEGSRFYNLVRNCTPLRNALLSIGYRSRSMRGDKYS